MPVTKRFTAEWFADKSILIGVVVSSLPAVVLTLVPVFI